MTTEQQQAVKAALKALEGASVEFDGCEINPANYNDCHVSQLNDGYVGLFQAIEHAVTQLRALTPGWESIATAPEHDGDGFNVARWNGSGWDRNVLTSREFAIERKYTHWCLLPEPPTHALTTGWEPWPPPQGKPLRVNAYRKDAGVFIAERISGDPDDPTWFTDGGREDISNDLPTLYQPLPSSPEGV